MLDIFRNDAFSMVSLTAALNNRPYKPARIGQLGLFREAGIRTTAAIIEEKAGTIELIHTTPRGAPAEQMGREGRKARAFVVPHLAKDSTVYADEVQNLRAFGSETEVESVQAVINERLDRLRAEHEVTLEHMRAGAIQGQVLDADGGVIFDLFTEFGVAQQTAVLTPDASADNGDALRAEVEDAERLIEVELGATPISGYRALCGKNFINALRSDLGVTQMLRFGDPQALRQRQAEAIRQFEFAGVVWEEYRGSVSGQPFFADDEAYLFPEGADIFRTWFAPADFVETVNTLGLPMYAKQAVDAEFQRWVKVHTQSNPLVINTRPRAVVKLTLPT